LAPERVHYLDWLKALIVYGIFLFHVSLVFSVVLWLVSNRQHSVVLSAFAGFTFPWGIPAMFLIAGADARFGLRSRSAAGYVRSRCLRLLLPLAAGMVLLTPLQRYVTSSNPPPPPGRLWDYYAAFLRHPTWDPLHLWFLGYLFAISVAALPVLRWLRGPAGRRLTEWLVEVANHRGGLFLLALPLVASQVLLRPPFPGYQSWADVATYSVVFVFGAVLCSDRGFEAAIRREIRWILAGGLAAIATVGILLLLAPGHVPNGPRVPEAAKVLYAVSWSLDIWCWLLAVLYLGIRWLDFPNRAMAYARDSILPFYVIHHPVVLVVSSFVVPLRLGVWSKFALIVVLGLSGTLLICEFGVRRWNPTRALFGLKPLPQRPFAPARPAIALR
jgi:glucans biosynthesis protein C